ncbi:hypothetical protein CPB84DRAFT_1761605 [Gymnopilus junonius]|uniref:Uncharacterized protein n=1 Tax=Gymnopilus junonius TaxID=109634 RepID=A0A9P5P1M9_GYMJU|nr:hypothetical protein CPB84DRAFT_1761605 [Gymnopilus junonius]
MRPNRTSLFTSKLLSLVKMAYDVRTALAEKDICGDLDLSVIGPDMPFQPKWMEEAHAMTRHQLGTTMRMEPIAGTCGMGLKRVEVKKDAASQQDQIVVLKPRVVLARVLDESP